MSVNYQKRIARVQAAIHADPAAEHSLDDLADIAALSRFHFHRVFTAMTGETVAEAVRRIRLTRAALALRHGKAPVAGVGRANGYPHAGSFSRAFRAAYGLSPSRFRKERADNVLPAYLAFTQGDPDMYPVTLSDQPVRPIIGVPHRGPYPQINQAFERLSAGLGAAGLWPQVRAMVAVFFDDPAIVAPSALRSMAGVSLAGDVALPPGLTSVDLVGGRHAVMRVIGPYSGLSAAYAWLYGPWLAHSGETPRDAPSWEHYVNSPMDTAPADLLTDIYLPLEDHA